MEEENCHSGIQGIVKQGAVKLKTGFGVWKKRWLVFQKATSYGPNRLVVCSKRESFLKHPFGKKTHTIVLMRDVNTVSQGVTKHGETKVTVGFNIVKPFMEFICLEAQEDYWVECIRLGKGKDENIDDDTFRVYLLPAISLNYSGECILQIRNMCLTLFSDEMKKETIVKWPLEVIRRFSKDRDNKLFFLETGRMSITGECLFNIRSYWFEEIFKKIVQVQATKSAGDLCLFETPSDIVYDESPKACNTNDDSDEANYLHPIIGASVRLDPGRIRCKKKNVDDPNQSHTLASGDKCYLSVHDSTCISVLEQKEDSPYLSMGSSHAIETIPHDDDADLTSQACAQHLSQDDSVQVNPHYQEEGYIKCTATETIEDEITYIEHDPLAIPKVDQRRSVEINDNLSFPGVVLPMKGDENESDESGEGDYLTPIADLANMSLKRIN